MTLLEAMLLLYPVGVAPNVAVFQNSGIEMNRFITVNEKMETRIKDIYAAGDVASVNGRWFGQWSVANKQGQVAGTNAAGGNDVYKITESSYTFHHGNKSGLFR